MAYTLAAGFGGRASLRSQPRRYHRREAWQEPTGHQGYIREERGVVQAKPLAHANPPQTPLPMHVLRMYGCCAPSIFPSSRICRKNMFRVQGQELRGQPTGCTSLIMKNARITGLDPLGALAGPEGEALCIVAKLADNAIRAASRQGPPADALLGASRWGRG